MSNHDFFVGVNRVSFKDYLPTPLRTLVPLTSKRQLVKDIQSSHKYLHTFPILEKLDNFDSLWENLCNKVNLRINELTQEEYNDFSGKWAIFHTNINEIDFSGNSIPVVPREILKLWPLDFSYFDLSLDDKIVIDYFDMVLIPSTNNVWEDLLDSSEYVLDENINKHIESLSSLREIKNSYTSSVKSISDVEVINLTAKMLGLSLRDELINAIGEDRISSLIPLIGQFYEINSTDDFIKLIELVISSRVLIEHLYTKDYINFSNTKGKNEISTEDLGQSGWRDFKEVQELKWFKTTHINLYVEYSGVEYLASKISAPLGSSVKEIVDKFIPLNLVLKHFGLYLDLNKVESAPSIYFSGNVNKVRSRRTLTSISGKYAHLIPDTTQLRGIVKNTCKQNANEHFNQAHLAKNGNLSIVTNAFDAINLMYFGDEISSNPEMFTTIEGNLNIPKTEKYKIKGYVDNEVEIYINCKKVAFKNVGYFDIDTIIEEGNNSIILVHLNLHENSYGYVGFNIYNQNGELVYKGDCNDFLCIRNSPGYLNFD